MTTRFLQADIQEDEGFRPLAYPDPRSKGPPWTIGFGHTGREVHPGLVWTFPQAVAACTADIGLVERGLDTAIGWWRTLNDARQDVLANMAFNMGVHGLLGFTQSLPAARAGEWVTAGADLRKSAWALELPNRSGRLIEQFVTGVRTPQPWDPKS